MFQRTGISSIVVLLFTSYASFARASERQYTLTVDAEGASFEVRINGEPVAKEDRAGTSSQGVPINKYLIVGARNQVDIKVRGEVAGARFSCEVKESSSTKPVVEQRVTLDATAERSLSAHFDLARDVQLAVQRSIFAEPAPSAGDIKLYGMVATAKEGVWAKLRLNGVEIDRTAGKGGSASGGWELQGWLMPGDNVFELDVEKVTAGAGAPGYAFTLHGLAGDGFPDDRNKIFGFDWPSAPGAAKPGKYTYPYKIVAAPPSLLWTKAAMLSEISAEDRKQIDALVQDLVAAMRAKNAKKVFQLWRWKFEDMARAAHQPVNPAEAAEMEQAFGGMLRSPGLKLTIVPAAQTRLTLVAGNRVVAVSGPGGEPLIAGKMEHGALNMPIFVAKIDGTWRLVR